MHKQIDFDYDCEMRFAARHKVQLFAVIYISIVTKSIE